MVDLSKRATLKGLAVAAAGGLAGGCCIPARGIEPGPSAKGTMDFLALPAEFKTDNGYLSAIDAHAHFFNATDMQAGGYLTGPVANEWGISDEMVRKIGMAVANIVTYIAPCARTEWFYIDELHGTLRNKSFRERQLRLDHDLDKQNKKIAEALYTELDTPEFKREYVRVMRKTGFFTKSQIPEFSEDTIYQALSGDYADITQSKAYSKGQFEIDPRRVLAIFGFLGRLLNYRILNVHAYREAYFFGSSDIKTVAACDALVDFDYWVGDCDLSYSRMRDQILLHQRIAEVTGNYTFPLVAYNPWSAIKDDYRYLELVEDAIKNRGFKGVKIYPPIGYFPIGNDIPGRYPVSERHPHPDLTKLDHALMRLYEITKHCDVPVMAHGNHSMGRDDAHKMMGGPDAWQMLFQKEGFSQLKANIGHFGGTHPDQPGQFWPGKLINLMKKNKNLYADIGFWDQLMKPEHIPMLVELLNTDIDGSHKASQRVMFGTDWYMLNLNPDWKAYTGRIFTNLKQHSHDEDRLNAFFHDNAKEFFKPAKRICRIEPQVN